MQPNTPVTPYSYGRIRQIMHDDYCLQLERIYQYKGSRNKRPVLYKLVREDGSVQLQNITLDALREYLTAEGYALKNE